MKRQAGLLFILFSLLSSLFAQEQIKLNIDGRERSCNIHLPVNYDSLKSYPLVLAFHGMNRSPELMEKHTHLSDKADSSGFIVAYPKMISSSSGWQKSKSLPFVEKLLDTLQVLYNLDSTRIYSCGFSSGAEMSYYLGYALSNRVAAFSGTVGSFSSQTIIPTRNVPLIHFHNKNDQYYSTAISNLDKWIKFNDCSEKPDTILNKSDVKGFRYNSSLGCDVVLYVPTTGGHSWPGGEKSWAEPSKAINATYLMWEFFKNYTLEDGKINQEAEVSFNVDNTLRYCKIHLPTGYNLSKSYPLVLAFHGMNRSPDLMEYHTHLSEKADTAQFIVAYPKMISSSAGWQQAKSLPFVDQLLDTLIAKFNIDTMRVYSCGFSSGAGMSYYLGYNLSNRIAAISGTVLGYSTNDVTPTRHVPVIHFHNKNDQYYSSAISSLNKWIQFNKCSEEPDTILNKSDVKGFRYQSSAGCDVVLYVPTSGGHSWPGGEKSWAEPSKAINATYLMWDFFIDYTLEDGKITTEVRESSVIPRAFELKQNYPNPFNPTTVISFSLPYSSHVSLKVFNLIGEEIATLVNDNLSGGNYNYQFNAGNFASGVYIYRIISGDYVQSKKMMLIK